MARLIWSDRAIADLESIGEFIAQDSTKYAKITINSIRQKARTILIFPQKGRMVPEFYDEHIRELIYKNYRIVYLISDNVISIVTVHHSAKLLK